MCLFLVVQRCLQQEGNDVRPHRFRMQNPWWPGLNPRLAHSRLGDRWAVRPRGTRDEVLADYPNLETKDIHAPYLVDRPEQRRGTGDARRTRWSVECPRRGQKTLAERSNKFDLALAGVFDLFVVSPFL
jgi:hypothetical protein